MPTAKKLSENIPNHVAIIMDGNGRWAKKRLHSRVWGHIRGARNVSHIVEAASALGIKSLTLYAFSSENWSRPLDEITTLFKLLKKFLYFEQERIIKNNIKFKVIGDFSHLPAETQLLITNLTEKTSQHQGLKLNFAFGYGGREEIVRGINHFIHEHPSQKITAELFSKYLYDAEISDIDLLIRTGGDMRVSNFLLWQIAYAEFYFTDILWPNFSRDDFRAIILEVSKRERRFGSVTADSTLNESLEKAHKNKSLF
ncbi:MAG: di-trans,poly-cis-decaprenylcistransferase [Bacteriovoracaceae bacterium]|nr:di-trans,poly-cis-decaprenylcistransferase [Bacteriovoracaceae bacterium]